MDYDLAWSRRKLITVCAIVGTAACLAIVTLVVLAAVSRSHRSANSIGGHSRASTPDWSSPDAYGSTTSAAAAGARTEAGLVRTDDPASYARAVALALFDVDPAAVSRSEFLRFWSDELPTVVYSDAATKGLTLGAQNRDAMTNLTSAWVPPQSAWSSEASEHLQSRLTITSVAVPDYWVNAVAAGQFRDPGLHLERVIGVLTQAYGATGRRYSSSRSVVIDLALLCGPTQPGGCRLLAPQQPPGLGDQ
jgi:hypothetical protein